MCFHPILDFVLEILILVKTFCSLDQVLCQSSMVWYVLPKLLVLLLAFQHVVSYGLQLLHLFEKLHFQIVLLLYLLGLVLDVYVPPPTPHLQLTPLCVLVSLVIIFVSCYEIVYACSSTTTIGVSCPPPLKLCGSFGCFSLITPLHLTSYTSCIGLDGFELSNMR